MLRVLSLFSGIGAFEKALTNLKIDYEIVNFCEIDKYAATAYCAIHNVPMSKNLGDITTVSNADLPTDIDLLFYGHPCQSFSAAGNSLGDKDPRGQLLYEALRVINAVQPKVAIEENVPTLLSAKFEKEFNTMLRSLEDAGYINHYQIYNAADYGIAQDRKRVFTVSVRNDIPVRYCPPAPIPLTKTLYNYLEDAVDEHYYIKGDSERMSKLIDSLAGKTKINTIRAGGGKKYRYKTYPQSSCRKGIVIRDDGREFLRFRDVSITIPARYYKGWGGFDMMGVAEFYEEEKEHDE